MNGWVYCMSNPCMPGLVKVGFTTLDPAIRAKDLFTTGVPTPFVVEFAKRVQNPEDTEEKLHKVLAKYYVRMNQREFFRCSPSDARDLFDLVEGTYDETVLARDLSRFAYKGTTANSVNIA